MNNIAIIPARSGSKGLQDKNIRFLNGKPLLAYSIDAAKRSNCFSEIMVSTDSKVYADIALAFGASVPFLRSEKLSNDSANSWDVVKEVLCGYLNNGEKFDSVCLLQPTSPLRSPDDIVAGFNEYTVKKADAITAVCVTDHSPLWTMTLSENLSLSDYRSKSRDVPRQKMMTFYRINGALYIRRVQYLNSIVTLPCEKEYAYIMDSSRSVDIDTLQDFEYAEWLMTKGNNVG